MSTKNPRTAFSLLELMVVIAVMGIVMAGATPLYREYVIKARIAAAMPVLKFLTDGIQQNMEEGNNTYPFTIGDLTISNTNMVAYDVEPVVAIRIYDADSSPQINSGEVLACVHITGLDGIGTYTAPTASTEGVNNRLCALVYEDNGFYNSICGSWAEGNAQNIDPDFLPGGCSCRNIITKTCS